MRFFAFPSLHGQQRRRSQFIPKQPDRHEAKTGAVQLSLIEAHDRSEAAHKQWADAEEATLGTWLPHGGPLRGGKGVVLYTRGSVQLPGDEKRNADGLDHGEVLPEVKGRVTALGAPEAFHARHGHGITTPGIGQRIDQGHSANRTKQMRPSAFAHHAAHHGCRPGGQQLVELLQVALLRGPAGSGFGE